jgi:hypothetical protein
MWAALKDSDPVTPNVPTATMLETTASARINFVSTGTTATSPT